MLPTRPAALLCLFLLLAAAPGRAEMRDQTKIKAGTPPAVVLKELFLANQAAVGNNLLAGGDSKFAPYLTWLADSDPRLQPEALLPAGKNRIYTVRNLGQQVATTPGSLDYGIFYLHTPVLLITGNTESQAIKLAMEKSAELEPELRRELALLQPAFGSDNPKEPFSERWRKNVEANVDYQVEQAMSRYGARIHSGRLAVIGAILDLNNEYRRGRGRLLVINVNGEREASRIRGLPHLASFDPKTLALYIGRQQAQATADTPTVSPPEEDETGEKAEEND